MVTIEVNAHTGVLTLQIDAPLASANVRTMSDHATAEVQRAGVLRGMIIIAPQFPPWRDLTAFLDNLRFMREHRGNIVRVAVLTESPPMSFAAQLAGYFPDAAIERFAAHSMERANAWVAGPAPAAVQEDAALQADEATDADVPEGVVELDDIATESGDEDDWFVKA